MNKDYAQNKECCRSGFSRDIAATAASTETQNLLP